MRFMLPFLTVCILIIFASNVFAQDAPASEEPAEREPAASVLPAGVPIKLVLLETLCSQSNQKGDMISFAVAEDILLEGRVIIPKGALAYGQVIAVRSRRGLGKGGALDAEVKHISLPGGKYIPLATELGQKSGFEGGKMLTRYIVWSVLTGVGGLIALGTRGKSVRIEKGLEVNVFTAEDVSFESVDMATDEDMAALIEKQKENEAISSVKRFGFGTKKVEDVLAEKGLIGESSWKASRYDDYTFQVTVTTSERSYTWMVNPYQDILGKKFTYDKIRGADKESDAILFSV